MANYRQQRINDQMTCELCRIIRNVKDPRVSSYLTTVTGCEVTADLKYAKVFYSFLDDVSAEEAQIIRKEIKNRTIRSFLYYVPYVTLAVMTFPAIVESTGSVYSGWAALLVGAALAWFGKSLFVVAVAACGSVFLLELLLL